MEGSPKRSTASAETLLNVEISDESSENCSNCHCCGENIPENTSAENIVNTTDSDSIPNCKLSKSNILDKLHFKLNQLNKLNARVQKCNDALENLNSKRCTNSFQSKLDFENFLRETYNDSRYSYCILKCGPKVPYRQLKSTEIKDERIPRNMGWNWKRTHDENWQPGTLPKIIKMRMSHFLNYYPCDTLPISRLNIKLSKTSFTDGENRETKIKKMIRSMGFSPCTCNKSIAWCMCRDNKEMNKLKNILQQIEEQIGESGLEYKLYLNDTAKDNCKKMSLYDKRMKTTPDLINQETQYEPMDFKILRSIASKRLSERLSKVKSIKTVAGLNPNNSTVTVPDSDLKGLSKKSKNK